MVTTEDVALCVLLHSELTGLNKFVCEKAIQSQRYEEIIIAFGQQAAEDAPKEMEEMLSPDLHQRLLTAYQRLKHESKSTQ